MHSFKEKVLAIVTAIPKGTTLSYGDVASRAGTSGAARAVGSILRGNKDTCIPCHRVIRADGSLGEYNGLLGKSKSELLREEGVVVSGLYVLCPGASALKAMRF